MIKEAIGKEKIQQQNFPKKISMGNKEITDLKTIAEKFNKFSLKLVLISQDIEPSSVTYDNYLKTLNVNQPEHNLTGNELKDAFFSLKLNKSLRYDEISFNAIKTCFRSFHKSLLHVFDQYLQRGIFPDNLEITKVTPSFNKGSNSEIGNYRPTPVFLKFLRKLCAIVFINT